MKLFEVYRTRWSGDTSQVRFWRTRLYVARWGRRAGWTLGLSIGTSGLVLTLLWIEFRLMLWSHTDDCDCDGCVPF